MPDTQISEEMVERGAQVLCGNKPFVTEYYRLLAKAVLEAALSGYVVGWREITEDNEPPRDVELLLGWWRTWPERKWEYASGLYGSTKGGWVHGNATHWQTLPAPPVPEMEPRP